MTTGAPPARGECGTARAQEDEESRCAGGATKQRVRRAAGVALILCPLHHAAPADGAPRCCIVLLYCCSSQTIGCQTAFPFASTRPVSRSSCCCIAFRW